MDGTTALRESARAAKVVIRRAGTVVLSLAVLSTRDHIAVTSTGQPGGRASSVPPSLRSAFARVDRPYLSLSNRPSHNQLYRAGVVEQHGAWEAGASHSWVVRITRADGTPVEDAKLAASVWMPAAEVCSPVRPVASAHLGDGRYQIDGLRFDAPGWWNVPLRVEAGVGIDSLAFNLVIPG